MSDLIFHLNDIDGNGSLEIIKSYLYPAIDKNIDFMSIVKSLEEDKDKSDIDRQIYNHWKRSGEKHSKDPMFYKYVFNGIKRSSGYVQEKT